MRLFWHIEMWCHNQAAAAILSLILAGLLTGDSCDALTTFGKTQTQAPKNAEPTAPPARVCSRQAECAGISSSSCVRTQYDATTRCLCADNQPPVNGQCEGGDHKKTLYHVCSNSDDCGDGLVCLVANVTAASPPHLRVHGPQDKICFCDVESGFKEKDHACNDADILKISMVAIAVVTMIRKLLAY